MGRETMRTSAERAVLTTLSISFFVAILINLLRMIFPDLFMSTGWLIVRWIIAAIFIAALISYIAFWFSKRMQRRKSALDRPL